MKSARFLFLAIPVIALVGCGGDGGSQAKCDADSTFGQIQEQIFEARGCTIDACHGSAMSGGLDLREGAAYDNLVRVPGLAGSFNRVEPPLGR